MKFQLFLEKEYLPSIEFFFFPHFCTLQGKKKNLLSQKQPVYLCVPLLLMFLLFPPSCETLPRGRKVQIRAAVV